MDGFFQCSSPEPGQAFLGLQAMNFAMPTAQRNKLILGNETLGNLDKV